MVPGLLVIPALVAAVVVKGEVVAIGAVGRRRVDGAIPVTVQDRFHLGSCTKAMTALLAAIAVERGLLRWESTLAELFPELRATMAPAMAGVTVRQLLSHSSGIGDDDLPAALQTVMANGEANLDGLRLQMVKVAVRQPLQSTPGTRFLYANTNYLLVGAALERLQQRTWEELIQGQIFQPLALAGAGLGPQSSVGLGHGAHGPARRRPLGRLDCGPGPPWTGPGIAREPAAAAHARDRHRSQPALRRQLCPRLGWAAPPLGRGAPAHAYGVQHDEPGPALGGSAP